jgi:hypothetical protein
MRLLLAVLSAWFPLTYVPSVGTVSWRCADRGVVLGFTLDRMSATTVLRYGAVRRTLNPGRRVVLPPLRAGTGRLELVQETEARRLVATLTVRVDPQRNYCWSYFPPPFTLTLARPRG